MKRVLALGLFLLRMIVLYSAPLSKDAVLNYAGMFIHNTFPASIHYTIKEVISPDPAAGSNVYVINLDPEGWILVSADDNLTPVLGFSFNGHFETGYTGYTNVNAWLSNYNKEMQSVLKEKSLKRNRLWDASGQTNTLKSAYSVNVEPILTVTWDQGSGWNRFCPVDADGPGGHAYSGCVGVAMAQAMSVYKYPVKGKGTFSYNHSEYGSIIVHFDTEPEYDWDLMAPDSPDDNNARLLYHTAVSVRMDFGPDGSGSQTSRVPGALITNFRYYRGVKRVAKGVDEEAWTQLIVNELLAGRPVIYSGDAADDEPGHCFDIDGVINEKYFHFNWGWSGRYNGYFTIDKLNPGTYDFFAHHEAVINIRPPEYRPTDLDLTRKTVMEGLPAGTYLGKLTISDEAEDNEYNIVVKGDSVGEQEYLPADFYISGDSLMTGKEFLYNEKNLYTLYIEVTDKFDHVYQEKFFISVLHNSLPSGLDDKEIPGFGIYPNPSHGQLFIRNNKSVACTLELINIWGNVVYQARYNAGQPVLEFNYSIPGAYILRIISPSGNSIVRKVLIN